MTDPNQPDDHSQPDPTADTDSFQRFVAGAHDEGTAGLPTERGRAVGAPFRILTLAIGLAVAAVIIYVLLVS